MNADKPMILIVRGAGAILLLVAAKFTIDAAMYLWQHRENIQSIVGIGNQVVQIGVLTLAGVLLWVFSKRVGPWLCSEPSRRKPGSKRQEHRPTDDDPAA